MIYSALGRQALPLLLVVAVVATFVWLIQGSSNTPRQTHWQPQWQSLESFALARRAPSAVAHNGYLYVIGGIDAHDRYVDSVEFAPILADGRLGPWRQTSALREGRFYAAAVAWNDDLYVIGGGRGERGRDNYPIASVERAQILPDGSLGPWSTVNYLTTPRRGLTAVNAGDRIYAIGGYNGEFLKSVEHATIEPGGNLGAWQAESHESLIDRYIHSTALMGDRIFLLGGHMRDLQQTSYGDVESAAIGADGHLSPWRIEPHNLLTPRLVAQAFALNNVLYIVGGHTGGQRLASVESSHLTRQGTLNPWRYNTALPAPRSAAAIATYERYVYVLGGGGDAAPLSSVVMAQQSADGTLGLAPTK